MRVRKFTNRGSTTKVIGKFPSIKLNRTVWWESQIERDYIYLLEFDTDVVFYQEQPLRIEYVCDGSPHCFTPDFLVQRMSKTQIVEVKSEEQSSKEGNTVLHRSAASACRQQGYEFMVVTDAMIRVQPRLNNLKLLYRYARTPLLPRYQILCHSLMQGRQQASFGEVASFFESKRLTKQVVYALIYWGVMTIDLMKPIDFDAVVCLPGVTTVATKVS